MIAATIAILGARLATADEVRYYEQNGVTYKETRKVVQRPVVDTRWEPREKTVYREQLQTEYRETFRTCYVPITEYQWVTVLRNRWNPFAAPYYAQELVPVRRWETRQEMVRVPTHQRQLIPETTTVQVPVTTQRIAEEEVITRVAVSGASDPLTASNAPATPLGGVARLESDPPRHGSNWQPASGDATIRR